MAQRRVGSSGWYDRAIVIDGLGGIGDPYIARRAAPPQRPGLVRNGGDRRDGRARHGDAGRQRRRSLGRLSEGHRAQAEHLSTPTPSGCCWSATAADILKAKREKKIGVVLGHAGHGDGRARARPAGAAEEGRRDDRPADLQQPQPRGRRRAGAGQCRPVEAGAGDDRADRGGEIAARPQPRRREDDGRSGGACEAAAGHQPHRRAGADRPCPQHRATRRSRRSPTRAASSASISCRS